MLFVVTQVLASGELKFRMHLDNKEVDIRITGAFIARRKLKIAKFFYCDRLCRSGMVI